MRPLRVVLALIPNLELVVLTTYKVVELLLDVVQTKIGEIEAGLVQIA
jgi:hypothetical protein